MLHAIGHYLGGLGGWNVVPTTRTVAGLQVCLLSVILVWVQVGQVQGLFPVRGGGTRFAVLVSTVHTGFLCGMHV